MVTDITNPFYAEIIRGAHEAAAELGYTVRLSHTQEDPHVERAWIERELSTVEGVVLASSRMSDSTIRTLAKQKPVVVLNRRLPEVPCLLIDNARGMRRALEHLGELGHTSVTYVSGPESSWTDGMRWQALREAGYELEMQDPPGRPDAVADDRRRVRGGCREIAGRSRRPRSSPTTTCWRSAWSRGCAGSGCAVPDDVSVVGVDNILLAQVVEPELTTVASPLRAQGQTAVRNLVADDRRRGVERRAAAHAGELVVRGSTAQRSRKSTSPALGTTKVSPSASAAARSIESRST